MGETIANAIFLLYGEGITEKIVDAVEQVISAVETVAEEDALSKGFGLLSGIACSFLIIYFFLDLTDQVCRDMFSFDKLCVSFMRLMGVFALLLCGQDIIKYVLQVGMYLCQYVGELVNPAVAETADETVEVAITIGDVSFTQTELADAIDEQFCSGPLKTVSFALGHIGWLIDCILIWVVCLVLHVLAYFNAVSVSVSLCLRLFWSPIAIVQSFSGSNSSGIRYIKKILGDVTSLAAIMLVAYFASSISTALSWGDGMTLEADFLVNQSSLLDGLRQFLGGGVSGVTTIIIALIPQLAAVGGGQMATKMLQQDVFV